jgi:oxygen-independent coproporphyrinogen-3 oxidase
MNDETLKRIGRNHTPKDIITKYQMARDIGFDNINMDIIIGLPGEGEGEIIRTMDALEKLSPESITIHTMSIKRASILNEMEFRVKNSTASRMYDLASSRVRKMGMYPYYMYRQKHMVVPLENVGYCKSNKESIYNIQMIAENISIVSFGADAITKIVFNEENRIERAANVKDVREYINRIDEMIDNKIEAISMLTK